MGIELRNITKTYGDVTALRNVDLFVEDGEFVTLLGPSGCGKTTLLRIVAGFIEPDDGEILINEEKINNIPPNQRPTGMVFQSYALFPHMKVKDNIAFGLRMRGASGAIDEKVQEVAELLEIFPLLDRYPSQLSGGQQQRVSLARTLAIEPYALLLDEPLAALDRKLRVGMRTELRKLIDKVGITTIFVTHDQEEALTMSDRVAVMNQGELIQRGTPLEIYDNPQTPFVATFIGESNLFQGAVRMDEDGRPEFDGGGLRLPVPDPFEDRVGSEIHLLLRPEHLAIKLRGPEHPKPEMGVPGVIRLVSHLGMSVEYEVEVKSGAWLIVQMVRSRAESPFDEGTEVWVEPVGEESYLIVMTE